MKVIFMGTPDFSVPCLERIHEEHEVLAVFTQPDKQSGRGKKMQSPPVKIKALEYGISVYQPEKINKEEYYDLINSLKPDAIIVVAYGQILKEEILNAPRFGCINVHASLLPQLRGAAPINYAIVNGFDKTGVTTMYMNKGCDTGDMILKSEIEIHHDMTAGELHDELMKMGSKLIIETLEAINNGTAPREKQDNEKSTHVGIIKKEMAMIDWNKNADDIRNLIRGFNPWPVAYTTYEGKTLKIYRAELTDTSSDEPSGTIISVGDSILVSTSSNDLEIFEIQFPNKKRMSVKEYIRGNEVKNNLILGE